MQCSEALATWVFNVQCTFRKQGKILKYSAKALLRVGESACPPMTARIKIRSEAPMVHTGTCHGPSMAHGGPAINRHTRATYFERNYKHNSDFARRFCGLPAFFRDRHHSKVFETTTILKVPRGACASPQLQQQPDHHSTSRSHLFALDNVKHTGNAEVACLVKPRADSAGVTHSQLSACDAAFAATLPT